MLLACHNICKAFGDVTILDKISFLVNEHDKVAVVGINGAGKSTLFKILTGELSKDSGEVTMKAGLRMGYLSQQQDLSGDRNIYDEALSVKQPLINLEKAIRKAEEDMKHLEGEELEKLMSKYAQMMHDFEAGGGYQINSDVTGVLKGLGFPNDEFGKNVGTLSGGQKTRLALAKILLEKPDIILLDEPTNHLDMESVAWLEGYLASYPGAVIVISHDRYFLDKIANVVVEIENTKAISFTGNYSSFAEKKAKLREDRLKAYLKQQAEIKHQEDVITKLRSFNREKSIKRAESREKMLEKIDRLEKPVEINDSMDIRLTPNTLSGNDVLTCSGLAKSFGNEHLFNDISFEIKRGDKVAIIGNNGTGKTTLLKIITGLLQQDAGKITLGAKVYIGYYDQAFQVLDPEKTLFDELQSAYPDMNNTRVRNTLAAFLFTGDDVFKLIRDISGGERGRVSLAKLMLSDANLLILDEPTNHLDMVSKEILEKAVRDYEGTVLYVSHDRYFINQTATKILELSDRKLWKFEGNYDYFLEKRDLVHNAVFTTQNKKSGVSGQGANASSGSAGAGSGVSGSGNAAGASGQNASSSGSSADAGSSSKLSWEEQKKANAQAKKLQNEIAKVEARIEELEQKKDQLLKDLEAPEIATNSYRLSEITKEIDKIDEETLELMERWEELNS